jgi:hypothetical protein
MVNSSLDDEARAIEHQRPAVCLEFAMTAGRSTPIGATVPATIFRLARLFYRRAMALSVIREQLITLVSRLLMGAVAKRLVL